MNPAHLHELLDRVSEIGAQMSAIVDEQRGALLQHADDRLARVEILAEGTLRTQIQLVSLVGTLTTTIAEHLLQHPDPPQ